MGQSRAEASQHSTVCGEHFVKQTRRGVIDQMSDGFGPRLIRNPQVLVAAPIQHHRAVGLRGPCEHRCQRTLSDAGLPANQHQSAPPLGAGVFQHLQHAQLLGPPNEPGAGPCLARL